MKKAQEKEKKKHYWERKNIKEKKFLLIQKSEMGKTFEN